MTYDDYCWDPSARLRQRDLTPRVVYDAEYLRVRYEAIDDAVRALSNRRRLALEAFVDGRGRLLDYGCGTGRFVESTRLSGWDAYGYDVVNGWLNIYDRLRWNVVTFFDSLEHLPDPASVIRELSPATIMISAPECHWPEDPGWFLAWKHRRPGEHLWHWNARTLSRFMRQLGYEELMVSHFEDDFRPHPEQAEPNILTAIFRR